MTTWSSANKLGLVLTALLGVVNVAFSIHFAQAPDGPPPVIGYGVGVAGAIMVLAAAVAWFSRSRPAATIASVANILQGISALPALYFAPTSFKLVAGGIVIATVLSVALTLTKAKPADAAL